MEDSDTSTSVVRGTAAKFLLGSTKDRKDEAVLPKAAAAPLTWRCVVIGEVPHELRHAFALCFELILKGAGNKQEELAERRFLRRAVPEVIPYLFGKLQEAFPEAKDLRIVENWRVTEKRPLFEAILRRSLGFIY